MKGVRQRWRRGEELGRGGEAGVGRGERVGRIINASHVRLQDTSCLLLSMSLSSAVQPVAFRETTSCLPSSCPHYLVFHIMRSRSLPGRESLPCLLACPCGPEGSHVCFSTLPCLPLSPPFPLLLSFSVLLASVLSCGWTRGNSWAIRCCPPQPRPLPLILPLPLPLMILPLVAGRGTGRQKQQQQQKEQQPLILCWKSGLRSCLLMTSPAPCSR